MVVAVAFAAGAAWAGTATQPSAIQKAPPAKEPLAPTTVTPAPAPSTGEVIYLTIPGISGDGPGGKIVCHSFRRGGTVQRDSATGGAGAGKVRFNEFTIKKTTDKASPAFFKAVATGAHFNSVVIEVYRTQADAKGVKKTSEGKPFLTFKFTTVFTTKIDQVGGGDRPMEEITFAAEKVE